MTCKYILSVVNGTGFSYGNTVDATGNIVSYYTNTTVGSQTIYNENNVLPSLGPAATKITNTAGNALLESWNSTQSILLGSGWTVASASGWQWRPPQGTLIPFSDGIQIEARIRHNHEIASCHFFPLTSFEIEWRRKKQSLCT